MRRKERELDVGDAQRLLADGEYGVLASVDGDGQPYALPLHYVVVGPCIYFHCASEGHKLENIRANPAVSFCVVGETAVLPREFATRYESAVAFGTACEVFAAEKQDALEKLIAKYSPEFIAQGMKYIAGLFERTAVVRIDVSRLSGKARR